ncbi:MAG: DUF4397 domain-containing protein [Ignavibacteriales bacterium]|nr:DUF4397 domain-containing protein [Ignavibacteriales bacterium]
MEEPFLFGQGINKNWNLKLKIAGPSTQLPAKVQIVHNSPEPVAKNVDVFVNGQRVLSNFEYKKATPFLDFQPNTAYSISLTLPGQPFQVRWLHLMPLSMKEKIMWRRFRVIFRPA